MEISPYLMRRVHGWGPKSRTCGECIFCATDDPEEESFCTHQKRPEDPFFIEREFKACGLFKSQWQHERELLEAQGQQRLPLAASARKKPERCAYDLPSGAELADQDWTTPGFFPRTVH